MDQGPRTTPVAAPAGGPRRASILAAAIVVALALAIVKPWSLGQAGPGPGASGSIPLRATPAGSPGIASATPSAPAGDPNAMACLADETEQVVTVERTAGREVRSWIAVPYISTSGPFDPRLEPLTIFSSHVVGLGVCAASTAPSRSPLGGSTGAGGVSGATLTDVRSIRRLAGAVTAVDLGPPSLLPGVLDGNDTALLYGPPSGVGPASPSASAARTTDVASARPSGPKPSPIQPAWRAGSYAIAFHFSFDDVTVVRWLRIDLVNGAGGGA